MTEELRTNWRERATKLERRWGLTDVNWKDGVSTARVATCLSPSGPAFLKLSCYADTVQSEERALRHFGDKICPRVLQASFEDEAILLERIDVQYDLSAIYPNVEAEVEVWASFFESIVENTAPSNGFRTLGDYALVFANVLELSDSADVRNVLALADRWKPILMDEPASHRLLHGDLHHFNLLYDCGGKWRMVDPHGVFGHPYYEVGAFMRNPMPAFYRQGDLPTAAMNRLDRLADHLSASPRTLARYGFFGVAFSIAWDLDEGSMAIDPDLVRLAQFLAKVGDDRTR
ncbi:MAG: aminoglycoside phosphotransferase family protein [Fimbriimonas sp.]|nr:aminoglycoside phosphotransferase family protein [Fimbriimonas sp.]